MSNLTEKEIYDLNNMNVAAQNVQLGNLLQILASSQGVQTYVYEQGSPADTWVVQHNLGRYPSVTVVDDNGNIVIGETVYDNENSITIKFKSPFSGKAYLN